VRDELLRIVYLELCCAMQALLGFDQFFFWPSLCILQVVLLTVDEEDEGGKKEEDEARGK